MKYALVSPLEPREGGYRITNVADAPFEVAKPFFWVECPDDCAPDSHVFPDPDGAVVAAVRAAKDHGPERKNALSKKLLKSRGVQLAAKQESSTDAD